MQYQTSQIPGCYPILRKTRRCVYYMVGLNKLKTSKKPKIGDEIAIDILLGMLITDANITLVTIVISTTKLCSYGEMTGCLKNSHFLIMSCFTLMDLFKTNEGVTATKKLCYVHFNILL